MAQHIPALMDGDVLVLRQLQILGTAAINDCSELLRLQEHGFAFARQGAWTITAAGEAFLRNGGWLADESRQADRAA